jgi:hypothetical protein
MQFSLQEASPETFGYTLVRVYDYYGATAYGGSGGLCEVRLVFFQNDHGLIDSWLI